MEDEQSTDCDSTDEEVQVQTKEKYEQKFCDR